MIEFDRVSKTYSGMQALANVNLKIPTGSMVFLTGHSGAGKSTLLKLIFAEEFTNRGMIVVDGIDMKNLKKRFIPRFRQNIGFVFQNALLLQDRDVFANVALPLQILGFYKNEIKTRVNAALDKVGLLFKKKSYPITLSSGQQQRVGIARAIVNRPKIILADEPTGNLDPELSWDIMQLFADFNTIGSTVLIASHDIAMIEKLKYPVINLKDGRVHHNDLRGRYE
jgi:cell division transport system ATP-binding protein